MTNRIPDRQNPNQSVFNGEQSVDDYLKNRPADNNPYANRGTAYRQDYQAEPPTDDYVYQEQRRKAKNEAALSTILGIGVAGLLALGVSALIWPGLFRPNDPQAPTVGPEQTESNTPTTTEPRTIEPSPNTVIIDRTETQIVPVPVETPASPSPQPNSNVNITIPETQPQTTPNVNVTVPPTQPETTLDNNGGLLDTNPSPNPDLTTTPSITNEGTTLEQTDPLEEPVTPPAAEPQGNFNNTDAGELVNPGDGRTDR